MQFPCSNCNHQLEVPDEAEGKKVRCPACDHVMVAARQTAAVLPVARRVAAGIRGQVACPHCAASLDPDGEHAGHIVRCPECDRRLRLPAGTDSPGPPAPPNIFTAPLPTTPAPQSPSPYQTPIGGGVRDQPGRTESVFYILPGILLAVTAGMSVAWQLLQFTALMLERPPFQQTIFLVGFVGIPMLVNAFILASGIQLARRQSLTLCRCGAILACIPFFGMCFCLEVPFGIWAAVMTFSPNAPRDFGETL